MKPPLRVLGAAGTLALALLAAPAAAQTPTTFEVTALGGLAVSAPAGPVHLGQAGSGGTIAAQLGAVTVSDQRGALLGSWTASVAASDFTTGAATADETIGRASLSYWSGPATAISGTAVLIPGQLTELLAVDLGASRTAFAATGTVGNNSATWNPTIIVTVPGSAVVGTYTGTITHSVG
jgi:hypothetical protein